MQNQHELLKDFIKIHGKFVRLRDSNTMLFRDGARLEISIDGFVCTQEPPADKYERLRWTERYHLTRLEQAVDAFNKLKSALTESARVAMNNSMAPGIELHEAEAELKKLQKAVRLEQREHKIAQKNTKANIPEHVIRREHAKNEAHRQANALFSLTKSYEV